ncbi:MAG: extracellular solute-binding protein [Lachnospiraceae bacterium]|nr:extracellular solute-binding protein [Lachnospiraceae bacterium]
MLNKKFNRALATVLAAAMLLQTCVMSSGTRAAAEENRQAAKKIEYTTERLLTGYSTVSSDYTAKKYAGETLTYRMDEILTSEYSDRLTKDNSGYENPVAHIAAGDKLEMSIDVPETALYQIEFDYLSNDQSILPIEMSFRVDGEYPFYETRNLKFETTWITDGKTDLDRYGNEIVTLPDKDMSWKSKFLMDASYRYSTPLLFLLEKGTHEISIEMSEGKVLLGNVRLSAPENIPEYTGSKEAEGKELITIEAEDFHERNDSSIHAVGEYDASLSPLSAKEKVLNILDGDSFKTAGQKVTYRFEVEKSGYYYIAMNYRQTDKNKFPVYVDFAIDGEIPNTEFFSYPIEHTTKFKNTTLEDTEGNYLSVYLEEGVHTISLTLSAEYLRHALEEVDDIMNGINDLSLEVTKVAGTNKDKYRDLKLTRYIPDVQERIYGWVDRLTMLADEAAVLIDVENSEDVAAFAYLLIAAKQLKTLGDEPDELIYRVAELSTSVNSINTQIANFVDVINNNKLSIDRIYVYQEDAKLPKGLNFFQSIWMAVMRFFYSFFGQSYSASNTDKEHLQVWVNRPRQYVEIMQKMIDEQFTPATGIEVDLSLMTDANKLVLSNASGDTPDIATGINYAIPFELGIRGALVDLTKFDNYKEIFGRYSEGILVSSVIGDSFISLPETMNFYVMFYRTDVLEKIGLEVPKTLDELIAILPDLQMRGLNVYYPTASMLAMRNFHGTTPIVFQNQGVLYGKTALDVEVDNEKTVEGFTQLTDLFTIYNMPVDVPNFYQHFRNGDLPLGIADFGAYNLILNAAPEIANSWEIALVPGMENEETGEIYRYMSGGAESTVMFASDDERERKAWEFMCWWSSAEVQAEFGQLLQIMYGDEYIWPTANIEAFSMLPFPTSDKNVIMEQAANILEAPRLLGSYMLEREMSNAFNDVVVNGKNLRSRIDDVVKTVERETERKLEEFGYIDKNGTVIREYEVPSVEKVREILNR